MNEWNVFQTGKIRYALPVPREGSSFEEIEKYYTNPTRYNCKYLHENFKSALKEHNIYETVFKFYKDFPKSGYVNNYRSYKELNEIFHSSVKEHLGDLKLVP